MSSAKSLPVGDKPLDVLARALTLLRSRNEDERNTGAALLRKHLSERARVLSAEAYAKVETDFINQLFDLVNSAYAHEKLGAILAIEEIIEGSKNAGGSAESTQGVNLANYLRLCFKQINDPPVLYAASRALGKLVRTYGGTLTLETVEAMTVAAIDWLGVRGQVEPRRLAGVLVLKELSQNQRAVIFTHVTSLFEKIWAALRDKDAKIRMLAVDTLTSALVLISERDSRYRYYKKLYEEATKTLEGASIEHLHGSLLVLGELLVAAHDFMQDRFRESLDLVLRYKDSKDRTIKRTVIVLLPRFVATCPDVFVHHYLERTMRYILDVLSKRDEFRPLSFISAGEIAKNMGGFVYKLGPYLNQLIEAVKEGMTIRGKGKEAAGSFCEEALTCTCMLAQALGNVLRTPMAEIIPLMFNAGLTEGLADALKILSRTFPKLLPIIQERLLEHLSTTLTGLPYLKAISSHTAGAAQVNHKLISANTGPALICLALRTLGSFNFSGQNMFDFLRDHVIPYLDDTDPTVRREAALTCASMIGKSGETEGFTRGLPSSLIGEVLEKLLLQAISDPDPGVRRVLGQIDQRFDSLLAENRDALRYLLIALNDEVFEIRDYAIAVIGRLAVRNPAHVLPAVRKTLTHLLSGLEFSGDDRNMEENARLLAGLLRAAQRVLRPYVEPVLTALLPSHKLQHRSPSVASAVLAALGETAVVAGPKLTPHLDSLLPLVLETLTDPAKTDRRSPALHALAQFVSATGQVSAYDKYPALLLSLLHLLQSESPASSVRREALRVLGVQGALDPYKAKQIELKMRATKGQEARTDWWSGAQVVLPGMVGKTEDYYSVVAITALMRVLRDPALASHRMIVASTVQYILKSLGTIKSVPLLKYIVPTYIHLLRTSDTGFREPLMLELVTIASIAKAEIAPYIDDLLERLRHHLAREYWILALFGAVITLIEELSISLRGDFTVCLPTLVPLLLAVIHEGEVTRTSKVLHALEVLSFTCNLEDYLNLVVPVLVSLLERPGLARPALKTLSTLGASLNFSEHASRIILPLSRLLRTADADTRNDVMNCMCGLVYQLRSDFAIFIPIVGKAMDSYEEEQGVEYSSLVTALLKNQPLIYELPPPPADLRRRMDVTYPEAADNAKLAVNVQNLQNAWEASQRVTRDDWAEWLKKLSVDLLQESSSRVLRSCHNLAQAYPPLARELFYAAFFSIWQVLNEKFRALFVQSILTALQSPRIGSDVMLILLNLTEFMEHDDKPLPIEIATLGRIAERCQADAKALHYKEIEFRTQSDAGSIEALIEINNRLQLADSSLGIFLYAQQKMGLELDKFYEKLGRWEDALKTYERAKPATREDSEAIFEGRVRCLAALDEYEKVLALAEELWPRETAGRPDEEEGAVIANEDMAGVETAEKAGKERMKKALATHAIEAAWSLGKWTHMEDYLKNMDPSSSQTGFYRAILAVHRKSYMEALRHVEESRAVLEGELVSVVNEGYERAYATLVKVQQLTELEEVIDYKQSADDPQRRQVIRKLWAGRLKSVQPSVDLWRSLLAVRSLAITPAEDVETWLDFARLCHKSGNVRLSRSTLTKLTGKDPASLRAHPSGFLSLPPWVSFAYFKQVWASGERQEAYGLLRKFVSALKTTDTKLLARCSLSLGRWLLALQSEQLDEAVITQALNDFAAAQKNEPAWYKGCHAWALGNFEAISHYERRGDLERLEAHLGPAVSAFFNSIALGADRSLQDVLRLLSLWFRYGSQASVQAALQEGFAAVPVDTWLQVIPQIIARINLGARAIRMSIADLLSQLGRAHPQALVYPLTVASKSQSASRRTAALDLLRRMRLHSDALIGETEMVSQELIRVSVLWAEHWHASLEEASRLYFSENNFEGMLDTLAPMHQALDKGPETPNEEAFARAYGRDLAEALEWTQRHARNKTKRKLELAQAWDLYYHVFRSIAKQLPSIKTLHLRYVSPKLLEASNLHLAVPGSYRAGQPEIRIKSFKPTLAIMSSKQRPRKLEIVGSDDVAHSFLLKGHEDIRQDERVMQLFSLVNNLFAGDPATAKSHLNIRLFSVTPLSPTSGLIGWVPNCDTLNMLITEYRESRQIQLKIEQRYMNEMMPAYDPLSVLQKVEVFEHGLTSTAGNDLNRVLWLRSQNSEEWLEKRLTYTRSLAVMSMVGYILGLGDRHPSNIMLERQTGKLIHIDFGDCFEVAMLRDKYPEKVPFRLTRMLVNALEASGIEGNFRLTCERVMQVLRDNKESLMAVLEAFVYDPLFNMRLLNTAAAPKGMEKGPKPSTAAGSADSGESHVMLDDEMEEGLSPSSAIATKKKGRMTQPGEMAGEDGESVTAGEVINEKALTVVARINRKLSGRDFGADATGASALSVPAQVERLITQATSVENLCQGYMGWMPFW